MKLSTLLILTAIVSLVYGIGFVLIPAPLLSIYGMSPGPGVNLMGQFFGVALIAIGLLAWFARHVQDSYARRAIILAILISDAVGLIVSLMGVFSGAFNAVGWSAVVIYLFFTLGYAYFQFMKPSAAGKA